MEAEIINAENFASIELDDNNYFKFCTFESVSPEGGHICSDFNACIFQKVDWYWGLFNQCNFIECRFTNCTFRGTSLPECRFIECIFTNCQFLKDNLNGECDFDNAVAYACQIKNCISLKLRIGL
jgi:uncharacterized protein YjbI with pentapeptide repeats